MPRSRTHGTAHGSEEGSLLLALLAVIIIGGLVTVLLASTVTGQRQVQFDRNFTNAIHPADSGIEAATTYINSKEAETRVAVGQHYEGTGHVDTESGYTFSWAADKVGESEWEVRSTGVAPDGTDRTVEAHIVPQAFFQFAAFAKTQVGLGGGNSADSYDPDDDNDLDTHPDPADRDTGHGIIGSNGVIVIGNESTADNTDGVELHAFDENDSLQSRVQGTCASCDDFRTFVKDDPVNGKLFGVFERPLVFDDWWVGATLSQGVDRNPNSPYVEGGDDARGCNETLGLGPDPSTSYSAPDTIEFTKDAIIVDGGTPMAFGDGIPPGVYCAHSISFTGSSNDEIDVDDPDAPDKDPVIIYTDGNISVASQLEINCNNASPYTCDAGFPLSLDLHLYSTGSRVTIRNQTAIAGLIYAPRALCGSSQSNASVNIFGSVVCSDLENVGNWAFHFDEALNDFKEQEYRLDVWREEPTGTSF